MHNHVVAVAFQMHSALILSAASASNPLGLQKQRQWQQHQHRSDAVTGQRSFVSSGQALRVLHETTIQRLAATPGTLSARV